MGTLWADYAYAYADNEGKKGLANYTSLKDPRHNFKKTE